MNIAAHGQYALPLLMKAFGVTGKVDRMVIECDVRGVCRVYIRKYATQDQLEALVPIPAEIVKQDVEVTPNGEVRAL